MNIVATHPQINDKINESIERIQDHDIDLNTLLAMQYFPECGGLVQGTTSTCDRISSTPFSFDKVSPFGGFLDAKFLSEFAGAKTSITCSQRIKRGMPSSLVLASKAITSDSVDEWETAPCFLQIHVMGTKVLGPTSTRYAPVVDFESSRLSAKLASENKVSLQCSGGSPTHAV